MGLIVSIDLKDTSFSFGTIKKFDTHIKKSIPDYDNLISNLLKLGEFFIVPNSAIYDLGTSTGSFLNKLKANININNISFIGVEKEENFFGDHSDEGITWVHDDILNIKQWHQASFITNIFTLQFIEPKYRLAILNKIYNAMLPNSGFVYCEKIYSELGQFENIKTFLHLDFKSNFFNSNEILKKEQDLRRLMKLNTKKEVEQMFKTVGWTKFDIIWQQLNFACWLIVK